MNLQMLYSKKFEKHDGVLYQTIDLDLETMIVRKYALATLHALNAHLLKLSVAVLGLLLVSVEALSAQQCDQDSASARGCPSLLMEKECRDYTESMARAASADERHKVKASYDQIAQEREKVCPCTPPNPDWIRLSQPHIKA